jgi:hypothetical protein
MIQVKRRYATHIVVPSLIPALKGRAIVRGRYAALRSTKSIAVLGGLPELFGGRTFVFSFQTPAKPGGVFQMTPYAQRSQIRQIAFAAAFSNRKDMIRIPEAVASRMNIQLVAQSLSSWGWDQLKAPIEFERIQAAGGAFAAIARQHLIA